MEIILATGGTGGHIFPAITLAKALKAQGYNCTLFTDKKINRNTDIKSYVLPLCKISGNIIYKLKFFSSLAYSCILALYQMRKLKPKLVIGFGSYASFPTLLAAKILSIPIILHEQNTVLGRVNKFFFKSAKLVATSFPTTKYAEGDKCIVTGNFIDVVEAQKYSMPLSPVIRPLAEPVYDEKFLGEVQTSTTEYSDVFEERRQALTTKLPSEIELCKRSIPARDTRICILIIAGSQGANFFDDVVSSVVCDLPAKLKKKIRIIQQCTKKNISNVESLYKSKKIDFELSEFFDDMEKRLANAHLVISRAGATSIAEITLAGRPAIYVPYPHSKDNHQFYNAKYIEDLSAAIIVEQNSEAKKNLTKLLTDLLSDHQKLHDMANNTKKTEIKNGVAEFIEIIKIGNSHPKV